MSVKSGPMGPALESAMYELPHIAPLLPDIIAVGGEKLGAHIRHFFKEWIIGGRTYRMVDLLPKTTRPVCLRKLSYFADKEGKTRVIGILDYWSQTACKPLHEAMARILKQIPADCTFNQGRVTRALAFRGPYYSCDLSNVTDRMPLTLQKKVVASIIGYDRAEAWGRLLSGHEFHVRGATPVKYACGQPMGAYSS